MVEDAQLAARFTKCLTKALYNRRASYLRAKAEQAASEISIEECSEEVDKMYIPTTRPVEEIVESKLMWESIRKYLHKLTPRECEVMISLYVEQLSVSVNGCQAGWRKEHRKYTPAQRFARKFARKWRKTKMGAFRDALFGAKNDDSKAVELLYDQFSPLLLKCSMVEWLPR